jgi:dTMP kinase
MLKNPYKGKFIAFEGPDGSGQSTQVAKLATYLERLHKKDPKHYPVVYVTKEPSTGVFGGFIREALRERWSHGPLHGPLLMQALFVADRAHHLEHEIIPELEKGHTVITDRYAFSTIAYGAAENHGLWSCLVAMNETFFEPDVTILLDVSANFCMKRMKKSRGHLELYEKRETLKRVLTNYRKLAKIHSSMRVINGERSVDGVFAAVKKIVL